MEWAHTEFGSSNSSPPLFKHCKISFGVDAKHMWAASFTRAQSSNGSWCNPAGERAVSQAAKSQCAIVLAKNRPKATQFTHCLQQIWCSSPAAGRACTQASWQPAVRSAADLQTTFHQLHGLQLGRLAARRQRQEPWGCPIEVFAIGSQFMQHSRYNAL